jgi:hypothetical protein
MKSVEKKVGTARWLDCRRKICSGDSRNHINSAAKAVSGGIHIFNGEIEGGSIIEERDIRT